MVCKKIGIAYKEHGDCDKLRCGDLDNKQSKKKWTRITRGNKITKKVAPYYVHLSNAYAKLAEFSADPGPQPPEHNTKTVSETSN